MIFDYLDDNHAITHAMFRRRMAGYNELGYRIELPQTPKKACLSASVRPIARRTRH